MTDQSVREEGLCPTSPLAITMNRVVLKHLKDQTPSVCGNRQELVALLVKKFGDAYSLDSTLLKREKLAKQAGAILERRDELISTLEQLGSLGEAIFKALERLTGTEKKVTLLSVLFTYPTNNPVLFVDEFNEGIYDTDSPLYQACTAFHNGRDKQSAQHNTARLFRPPKTLSDLQRAAKTFDCSGIQVIPTVEAVSGGPKQDTVQAVPVTESLTCVV